MDGFQAYRDAAREDGVPEHAIELALRLGHLFFFANDSDSDESRRGGRRGAPGL
ncbi:hypothetical protein ACFXKD_04850 [Nocardiopsis aegyptia]|uniref:hypothetical protein n=1 Tax=Nocardiopsis aegyptia TaxID=220378 RepID=UPI00366B3CF9